MAVAETAACRFPPLLPLLAVADAAVAVAAAVPGGRPIVSSGSETAACPLQNLRPSAAASFHCWLWPMLLWPWPLRSLLQCCGRPIVSSGSETAACPLQNLRPSAAASFHCWLWRLLLWPWPLCSLLLWPHSLSLGSETASLKSFDLLSTAGCGSCCCGHGRDCRLPLPSTAATAGCGPCCCGRGRCGPCCSAVAAQSFLRVPRLPPAPFKTSDPPLQLPFTAAVASAAVAVAAVLPAAMAAQSFFGFRDGFPQILRPSFHCWLWLLLLWPWPRLPPAASLHCCHCWLWPMLLWPWPLRSLLQCCGRPIVSSGSETAACPLQNLRPSAAASFHCCCGRGRCGPCCSAVAAQWFLRGPRLPPAPFKTSDPPLQLPFTAGCGVCCCGRGRCAPCCSAVAAQSFLRVPRLPPAPFKTSDPPLQLPFTAAVAVAAAVPAAVLWPPNRFFGFRDCRLPPSKPPTLRCSFLSLLAVASAAVAVAAAVLPAAMAAQSFFGFRDGFPQILRPSAAAVKIQKQMEMITLS